MSDSDSGPTGDPPPAPPTTAPVTPMPITIPPRTTITRRQTSAYAKLTTGRMKKELINDPLLPSSVTTAVQAKKHLTDRLLLWEDQDPDHSTLCLALLNIASTAPSITAIAADAIRSVALLIDTLPAQPPPQQSASTPLSDALASNLEFQVSSLVACLVDTRKAVETNKNLAEALLRTIDEAWDDLHNTAQFMNDTVEELTGIPSQIMEAVSNAYPQQATHHTPYRDALLMDTDEVPPPKAAPRTLSPCTDNSRANAAIKERQILLDIQPGHSIFNDDTPHSEMAHALQKALKNMQAPEGPSLQVKALTCIRNGGFVVEMDSAEAAAWVRDPIRKLILTESLGGNIRLKDRT